MQAKRPNRNRRAPVKKRNKRQGLSGLAVFLIISVVMFAFAAAGVLVWYKLIREPETYDRYKYDVDAISGKISQMNEEEAQQELDNMIEEGMFRISIASSILFDPQTEEGNARIENVAQNRYLMQVDLYLCDEEWIQIEKVYSSALLKPGYSIENIKLNRYLEPGVYNALAIFTAVTPDTMQEYGTAGAQVKLYLPDVNGQIPVTATPAPMPADAT